jgi:pyruvate/2-oxoglutarate/acetoin dehydrogenase E1 component
MGAAVRSLDAPVVRCAPPDVPIPYNKGMMDAVIPPVERVAAELMDLLKF